MSELKPADAMWDAIAKTKLGMVSAEDLVGAAEAHLGHPIEGHLRVDLRDLAQAEIDYATQDEEIQGEQ